MLNNKLFPFMDADGAGTGVASAQDGAGDAEQENPQAQSESGQEGADERKTGDVKSEAQKIADAMLAKKMKGMPSKEELAAFKKWQDEQKTENERLLEAQKAADAANAEASKKEAKANAMIAAVNAGIKTKHLEDAVILAMARVNDDISIEEAIQTVAKNNPAWVTGVELPGTGGNPANDDKDKKEPPIMI
jgi:hypothetical protein